MEELFSYSVDGKQVPLHLEFLEGRSWVLARGVWSSGYTIEIEYEDDLNEVPLSRKYTTWIAGETTRDNPRRQGIRKFVGEPPASDSIFSPGEFGFPDFTEPTKTIRGGWRYTGLVVLGFLAFASVMIWRSRRVSRLTPTSKTP